MTHKKKFIAADFEPKWQKIWEEKGVYQPDMRKAKKPYYNLMMFPYPSAEGLHVGNVYAFTGADIYGRFQRMKGFDVFEPIGLDGFGIHSENYALKIGRHPMDQSKISQKNFYRQLRLIGNGFAWKNKLETYDPDYYRYTQWLFIQMFKAGLAYRKKSAINFCPSCKTGLADEQVIDGCCERCKSKVVKKDMEQWFFRITRYAERLLQNTYQDSFNWSNKVKISQRNWIGKKEGINITYPVFGQSTTITCFTTRPDTNFGATFIVVAPEHPFVVSILSSKVKVQDSKRKEIENYVNKAKSKSEIERIAEGRKKTGVFTGFYAVNQLTNRKMPIYVTDFVLGHVGTGAVVGVPGHDKRDFEFAKEFNLPIIRVVVGSDRDTSKISRIEQVQEEEGTMVNSGFLNGMDIHKAIEAMMDYLEKKKWGKRVTVYKLRDWCISRQRYWGAPIPMIFCPFCAKEGVGWLSLNMVDSQDSRIKYRVSSIKREKKDIRNTKYSMLNTDNMAGWYPVPEKDLPVLLPYLKDWKPEGTGRGPLAKAKNFYQVSCPQCGKTARRETDVCDTFLDSSWYFLRYPSTRFARSGQVPFDSEITKKWLPVDMYIGGAEHSVLHLLYSRFITMVLEDLGFLEFEEPYKRFYAHGLIIAEGAKMSKSRGNIVVPDKYIKKYGADTLRAYLMFLGPFDAGGDFRDTGIFGMYRFLGRVWRLVISYHDSAVRKKENNLKQLTKKDQKLTAIMHRTIKAVTEDLENLRYNTAIAHIMEYVNELTDNSQLITYNHIKSLLLIFAPFAPYMTEELWQKFISHNQPTTYRSIHLHPWPSFDPKYLFEEEVTIIVQVNGKLRETIKIKDQKSKMKNEVEKEAQKSEKVKKYLRGKTIRKVIFLPGKLINFVV